MVLIGVLSTPFWEFQERGREEEDGADGKEDFLLPFGSFVAELPPEVRLLLDLYSLSTPFWEFRVARFNLCQGRAQLSTPFWEFPGRWRRQ